MPRDPGLLHMCALLNRMEARFDAMEDKLDEMMQTLETFCEYSEVLDFITDDDDDDGGDDDDDSPMDGPVGVTGEPVA